MNHSTLTLASARNRLAALWLITAAFLVLLMIAKSLFGAFDVDDTAAGVTEAWAWFMPAVMPTLALIIGSLTLDVGKSERKTSVLFPFRVAFWISMFYLGLLLLALVFIPASDAKGPMYALTTSNIWLGPIQGLVAASLGWFFMAKDKT